MLVALGEKGEGMMLCRDCFEALQPGTKQKCREERATVKVEG